MEFKHDCIHYKGEKPCRFHRLCEGCDDYEAWGENILIIKIGAMGDVMRTTSILRALRRKYPSARVTWLTGPECAPLLRNNPDINEIIPFDARALPSLLAREFDLLLSLDKSPAESGMAMLTPSKLKLGVGLSPFGTPYPLNPEADYYFKLGLDDDLKFRKNKKTYPELLREVCALDNLREPPELFLTGAEIESAREMLASCCGFNGSEASDGKKKIGIFVGAGGVFANKTPRVEKWRRLIAMLLEDRPGKPRLSISLLGGPREKELIKKAAEGFEGFVSIIPPTDDVRVFSALVSQLDALICGDTLVLHIACAVSVPVVAIFGPTCEAEIDLYDRGVKIVSPMDCAPCYKGSCERESNCMDIIDLESVVNGLNSLLEHTRNK